MNEIISALIGALTVATIAVAGWLAPRITRTSRLLRQVRRLSESYANLPETANKARLANHIDSALADLNTWLDPINRRQRALENLASWSISIVAVAAVLAIAIRAPLSPATPWLEFAIGVAISVSFVLLLILIDRHSSKSKQNRDDDTLRKASEARMATLLNRSHLS